MIFGIYAEWRQGKMVETDRLIIDELRGTDKEDYFFNISHDKEVLKTFICTYADSLETFDFERYLGRKDLFAIRKKDNKRLIGIFVECDIDKEAESLEIGYGLGSTYWGNGYMSEVVKAMLDYYFKSMPYKTVYASFFPENTASKRVMEKCGMVYSHTNRKELTYMGTERDLVYYRIDRK